MVFIRERCCKTRSKPSAVHLPVMGLPNVPPPDEQELQERCAAVRATWDRNTEQQRRGLTLEIPKRFPRIIELDGQTRRILEDESRLVEEFH